MSNDTLYSFEPPLDPDVTLKLAQFASGLGRTMHQETPASLTLKAQELLKERGPSALLLITMLTEDVLPDSTPRDALLDTIRYQLNRCNPTKHLLIIDPYLFPTNADAGYLKDLLSLVEPSVTRGIDPTIVTKQNADSSLVAQFLASLITLRSDATATIKYSDAFHDRFWIADNKRGLFMGTSLNGLGRRYAIADYLRDGDVKEITARVVAL